MRALRTAAVAGAAVAFMLAGCGGQHDTPSAAIASTKTSPPTVTASLPGTTSSRLAIASSPPARPGSSLCQQQAAWNGAGITRVSADVRHLSADLRKRATSASVTAYAQKLGHDTHAASDQPPPIGASSFSLGMASYETAGVLVLEGKFTPARTELRRGNSWMAKYHVAVARCRR